MLKHHPPLFDGVLVKNSEMKGVIAHIHLGTLKNQVQIFEKGGGGAYRFNASVPFSRYKLPIPNYFVHAEASFAFFANCNKLIPALLIQTLVHLRIIFFDVKIRSCTTQATSRWLISQDITL